jgi:glutaredoxin 3
VLIGWKYAVRAPKLRTDTKGEGGMSGMTVKVEMYTSANCAYCVAAKNLLKHKGLDYQEYRIDLDPLRRAEMLARASNRRTVPQIFINGAYVGGFEELAAADHSGKLVQLINAPQLSDTKETL